MTDVNALAWKALAHEAGLQRPSVTQPAPPFRAALLGGSALAFVLGASTGQSVTMPLGLLLSVVLFQPILEELLFRGFLQGFLLRMESGRRSAHGITVANATTSTLFVAAHLVYQPPLWAVAVFFPSLVFGFFRDKTGSVLPAIALHVAFNGMFFSGRMFLQ